jgi:hypothetical protein
MGIERRIERARRKMEYRRFAMAWRREKGWQKYMRENGHEDELKDVPALGRRPSFREWQERIMPAERRYFAEREREALQAQVDRAVAEAKIDFLGEKDLEWEDPAPQTLNESVAREIEREIFEEKASTP